MAASGPRIAVVPARGGSKRVPRKNLRPLGGVPLVVRALRAAVDSGVFDHVLLSSDDPEILALAHDLPGVTAHARDPAHATDTATVFGFLRELALTDPLVATAAVLGLLLPPVPFRTAAHVREAASLLDEGVDAVVSFTAFEFPPQFAVVLDPTGLIRPLLPDSPLVSGRTRSQDQAPTFRPNGAVYLGWREAFLAHRGFYAGRTRAYVMDRESSIDIDTEDDWAYAAWLLERREGRA